MESLKIKMDANILNKSNYIELSNIGRYQYFIFCALVLYFTVPHHLLANTVGISELKAFDLIVPLVVIIYLFCKVNISKLLPVFALGMLYLIRSFFALDDIGPISMIYALKFLEYAIVIFCIKDLRPIFAHKLIRIYIFFILTYICLEFLGVNIGLLWDGRFTGHFGGPYELSAIALLFFFFYKTNYLMKTLFLIIIFLSGTKAAYIALVIGLAFKSDIKNLLPAFLLGTIFLYLVSLFDPRFSDFISNLSYIANADIFYQTWSNLPKIDSHDVYMEYFYLRESEATDSSVDLSSFSRLYTYLIILKSIDVSVFFFGHGPGFFGSAVDSSILRIFGETGIFGLFTLYFVLKKLSEHYESNISTILIIVAIIALSDVLFSARFLVTLALINQLSLYKENLPQYKKYG
jgi:hypothetical protein